MLLMCTAITLAWREIPRKLIRRFQLEERVIQRSETADKEILFLQRHRQPLLPVFYQGELQILPWGNRQRNSSAPLAWWCDVATLQSGAWAQYHPEPVEILANFGLERGVWFLIREGLQGVLIHDQREQPSVYLLLQPASHYYQVMTGYHREPVFLGEQI
ncbi:hypothetical protein HG66A1_14540 [Gimesia chilikensis]|uniref:Uncharacterized protein n=2 Tax=Gimesia chilikensis TaxID=2605989 RepID=A0A517PJY0_9PLAN|nr:hypothetical protein HG66A1_14540 [Gimesia chilikensis]QDT83774.1 hypothetical protein MalM14_14090 [Gimesia chilikensis]